MTLKGQTVLITGASGGLGTFVTRAFLDAGAKVFGSARSIANAEFNEPGFTAVAADITTPEGAQKLVAAAGKVDVLVHLVGGFAGGKAVHETDLATYDRMMDMNLKSVFLMLSAALPGMTERKSGCVLAIGTRAAVDPKPMIGVYAASKAALVTLIRTVALETVTSGVSANVILPGTMNTPANRKAVPDADHSQWVDPADVAALLVHLATNRTVTGAVIPVSGKET